MRQLFKLESDCLSLGTTSFTLYHLVRMRVKSQEHHIAEAVSSRCVMERSGLEKTASTASAASRKWSKFEENDIFLGGWGAHFEILFGRKFCPKKTPLADNLKFFSSPGKDVDTNLLRLDCGMCIVVLYVLLYQKMLLSFKYTLF